jgi:hypothetical protein
MNMDEQLKYEPDDLSDNHILETLQATAEESEVFSATSKWGYDRLKKSFESRGDSFDRCGAIVFSEGDVEVVRIPISCLPATIGSADKVDYALTYPGVSRLHCHLELVGSLVRIIDDASTNGLMLNGKRVESEDLCDGDEIVMGTAALRIRKV